MNRGQSFPGMGYPSVGRMGEPLLSPITREISRMRAGRPAIVGDHVTIAAASEGQIDLKISTAAPMFVEYMVCTIDDTPLFLLTACPIDIRSITLQREEMQSEENIITGQFNLLCALNGNGASLAQYLSKGDIIHQGATMNFVMVNRDALNPHRVDIAVHGFLVTKEQLDFYLNRA